eukprot:TRINITY_DN7064_c3_g1_i1.p1 TRINITY_DN7064_c3_g1~~TRINITY_DN7064_c3_g1_i1.p1  ORF type:complete len:343 (+),score=47.46 TRINITY_DN7064_c3_g1_i1:60-1088(+)
MALHYLLEYGPEAMGLYLLLGHHQSEPLPVDAVRALREIRRYVVLFFATFFIGMGFQLWCALDGYKILHTFDMEDKYPAQGCEALYYFTATYCVSVAGLPLSSCTLSMPITLLSIVGGRLIRLLVVPVSCSHQEPQLWAFVDEVFMKGIVTVACLPTTIGLLLYIKDRLSEISDDFGLGRHSSEEGLEGLDEVKELIRASPPPEATGNLECSICLGEGTLLSTWRTLPCKHYFHEECLFEWLKRSRRCPLCRVHLNIEYLSREDIENNTPARPPATLELAVRPAETTPAEPSSAEPTPAEPSFAEPSSARPSSAEPLLSNGAAEPLLLNGEASANRMEDSPV